MTDHAQAERPSSDRSPSGRSLPVATILAAALGMGFAGDLLLRTSDGPGLGFSLLFVGLAASSWLVTRSSESPLGREASTWLMVGVLCGAALIGRGSQLLRFGTFLAACTAFTLPALRAGRDWVRRCGTLDVVESVVGSGLYSALGSLRLIHPDNWGEVGTDTSRGAARSVARTALGGVLLALVPLAVFGALFMSADEVFATMVSEFVQVDVETIASHLLGVGLLTWLAGGYLVGMSSGTRLNEVRRLAPARPTLGIAQVATALGLVDLLFGAFVIVQFRYLFGGASWVELTPDLTYADYAREGFFQLVAAVALAIPWLLGTHALLGDRSARVRGIFGGFAGVHVLLLLAIVASAIQRMLAYQSAYGLTEDRVFGTAVLVWLTVVVLWFAATVFTGRRHRFAFGGLVTAYVLVGALHVIDPVGMVARHNLDRIEELGGIDTEYLASLGSDAAPLLLARLNELPAEARCSVATRLLRRWGTDRPADWKAFNVSEHRAREAVARDLAALQSLARDPDQGGCDGAASRTPASPTF
jgi:hypothetical protein